MRTIRRSGARDLPPSVDDVRSSVTVQQATHPKPGDVITVFVPCGIDMRVRVSEITPDPEGWMGWAMPIDDAGQPLRALGVPIERNYPMRIFEHQVVDK